CHARPTFDCHNRSRLLGNSTRGDSMRNIHGAVDSIRRRFLKVLIAAGAAGGLTGSRWAWARTERDGRDEVLELTATEALAAIAAGDLRAETYAAILLARACSLKDLNVLIAQDPDQGLEAARAADKLRARGRGLGPLHGLPLLIKDNINTATLPTTAGTPSLIDNRPRANARVVDALLGAGGIVFGKANMHELAFGITSNNGAFGSVRNPYDTSRIPGGSSGGNAAGVAARFAPAGIGTDTGGSTRIPAALCGGGGFGIAARSWSRLKSRTSRRSTPAWVSRWPCSRRAPTFPCISRRTTPA